MALKKNKTNIVLAKAQAALEFLITYGWAFLLILVMIGALAHFGVLDPSKYAPQFCHSSGQFVCREVFIGNGFGEQNIIFVLTNKGPTTTIVKNTVDEVELSEIEFCEPINYFYVARNAENTVPTTDHIIIYRHGIHYGANDSVTIEPEETFLIAVGCKGTFSAKDIVQTKISIPHIPISKKLTQKTIITTSGKINPVIFSSTEGAAIIWHIGEWDYVVKRS